MNSVPVWVQVMLSGMRLGTVFGVATGWALAAIFTIDLGGPGILGLIVGYLFMSAVYGTILGASFGVAIGLIVGFVAGLVLQLVLRIVPPGHAVVVSLVSGIGLQVAAIAVLVGADPWAAPYLVIPGIAAVPLFRTLRRVVNEGAEPPVFEHRRDTFAG